MSSLYTNEHRFQGTWRLVQTKQKKIHRSLKYPGKCKDFREALCSLNFSETYLTQVSGRWEAPREGNVVRALPSFDSHSWSCVGESKVIKKEVISISKWKNTEWCWSRRGAWITTSFVSSSVVPDTISCMIMLLRIRLCIRNRHSSSGSRLRATKGKHQLVHQRNSLISVPLSFFSFFNLNVLLLEKKAKGRKRTRWWVYTKRRLALKKKETQPQPDVGKERRGGGGEEEAGKKIKKTFEEEEGRKNLSPSFPSSCLWTLFSTEQGEKENPVEEVEKEKSRQCSFVSTGTPIQPLVPSYLFLVLLCCLLLRVPFCVPVLLFALETEKIDCQEILLLGTNS